jgi:glycosyltransferase involved in cell wall biosynthesis
MRILYVTTVGSTMVFFRNLVKELISEGNIVDIATNESNSKVQDCYREWGCKIFQISTSRSPFGFGNIRAIKEIRKIAQNYDVVHCHTPLAGIATRFGCKKLRKKSLKVIYTAHGFHFYKGAPIKNWLIYYPFEKICSRWTDLLITINKEDFSLAKKKMKAKKIVYIPGVGIDVNKFSNVKIDINKIKKDVGIPLNSKVILSVGELNTNKNHKVVIEALSKINDSSIFYLVAGIGDQKLYLEKLAKELNVNLKLLGFRTDVAELYHLSDLYIHSSIREGLPVSVMEAMASSTNIICSNIRGCSDLIEDSLFEPHDSVGLSLLIKRFLYQGYSNKEINIEKVKHFDYTSINDSMINIYKNII